MWTKDRRMPLRHPLSLLGVLALGVYDPLLLCGVGLLFIAVEFLLSQGIGLMHQLVMTASLVYFLGQISGA